MIISISSALGRQEGERLVIASAGAVSDQGRGSLAPTEAE